MEQVVFNASSKRSSKDGPFDFAGFALGLLMMAGYYKADPRLAWLPLDLTLLAALGTGAMVLYRWVRSGLLIPNAVMHVSGLFFLFALPVFWTDWSGYAQEKTVRIFTLTLLSALAPLFLFRTTVELRRFMNALALFGMIFALDAGFRLLTTPELQRLTAFEANTIALGRAAGTFLLWATMRTFEGRVRPPVAAITIGLTSIVLLGSGSRGPLLATFAGLLVAAVIFQWGKPKRLVSVIALAIVVGWGIYVGSSVIPSVSALRVSSFLKGDLGTSEAARLFYYYQSLKAIPDAPLGYGWGGFSDVVPLHLSDRYPHNILLEVFLEAGWLAGLYLLLLILRAFVRLAHSRREPDGLLVITLLVFSLANAMVSGDINDNRLLFAVIGVAFSPALANKGLLRGLKSHQSPEQ